MTAPTLPDTLARLARLLPSRVRVGSGDAGTVTVLVQTREVIAPHLGINSLHSWECIGFAGPDPRYVSRFNLRDLRLLETALREECAARGWPAELTLNPPGMGRPHGAVIWSGGWHSGGMPSGPLHFGKSDTPAHALALALVSALGGEGT